MVRFCVRCSWGLLLAVLAACGGGDGEAACLEPLELDCATLYDPEYEMIYDQLFGDTCSQTRACHSPEGAAAGLIFDNPDQAYDALLGGEGRTLVIPEDPECSTLIQRLESTDPDFVMPRGSRLSEQERCTIRQWVANGARR